MARAHTHLWVPLLMAPPQQAQAPVHQKGSLLSVRPPAKGALGSEQAPGTTQDPGPSGGEGHRELQASERSLAHTAPCKYRAKNFLNVSGWKPVGPTGSWKEHSPLGSCY